MSAEVNGTEHVSSRFYFGFAYVAPLKNGAFFQACIGLTFASSPTSDENEIRPRPSPERRDMPGREEDSKHGFLA